MCGTCGCSLSDSQIRVFIPGEKHEFKLVGIEEAENGHNHIQQSQISHTHEHPVDVESKRIQVERDILGKNNLLAQRNRGYFEAKEMIAINLVSSPGSGKTSLLEKTLSDASGEQYYVIEGDQQTARDADRIAATGTQVVQINTGSACHLDAAMVHQAIKKMDVKEGGTLFIENVGNLVCPSMFDLGESKRVVIISVTEGDDKAIKYPDMFHSSDLCIINKIDLLPYVKFDVNKAKEWALKVNHHLEFIEVSATTGEGMDQWYGWLKNLKLS